MALDPKKGSRRKPAKRLRWEKEERRSILAALLSKSAAGCGADDDVGHAENESNNRCDALAVAESRKFLNEIV